MAKQCLSQHYSPSVMVKFTKHVRRSRAGLCPIYSPNSQLSHLGVVWALELIL